MIRRLTTLLTALLLLAAGSATTLSLKNRNAEPAGPRPVLRTRSQVAGVTITSVTPAVMKTAGPGYAVVVRNDSGRPIRALQIYNGETAIERHLPAEQPFAPGATATFFWADANTEPNAPLVVGGAIFDGGVALGRPESVLSLRTGGHREK